MSRLKAIDPSTATGSAKDLLGAAQERMGMTPNILKIMANSPAALQAYLGFSSALAGGSLSADLRERIALAVSEKNGAKYCLSAHGAIGRTVGLSGQDITDSRLGTAPDRRVDAALCFATKLVVDRGEVDDEDVERLRSAGYDDGEIAEIVANVALNLYTNYFNHVADPEIDFPVAAPLAAAQ
jgi:uncharacterized peroxidase-related enzyme